VECLAVANCNVGISVLEVAMRVFVQLAKLLLTKLVFVAQKQEKYNALRRLISSLNVKAYVKRKELVENIFVILSAVLIEILLFWQTTLVNLIVTKCSTVENTNVDNLVIWVSAKNAQLFIVSLNPVHAVKLFLNLQLFVVR
jgi:hypothetical protein